ncbi:hypothetical protein DFO67_108134 [Modicisalibacter xianhensis]|uniref:DdrB-like domain-containing protein n=1 Tax=Modicisalibacter xianhensis TaxID=442341 RepID=A0A4R8FY74_9GAMM|nr:LPD38 domain-containing protein [Halomonas xianhensis]TDX29090.1 hypothetical protein DFO67_108134 [Halomonas xianhensis]
MALLDDIRQKNPSLRDRSDAELKSLIRQSPEFSYFSDDEFDAYVSGQPSQAKSESKPGFMAGLSAGMDQMQAMGGGLIMAAGDKLESEGMLNAGRDIYQKNMAEADENSLGYGFTDLFTDPDTSALQWASWTAGNLLPMMATSMASGGVGGIGARMLAGSVAKQAATRAGQAIGAYVSSAGMETGSIMGEVENADVALAHGSLAGALDALPVMRALRKFGGDEVAQKAANEIADSALSDLRRTASRSLKGAATRGGATQLLAEASTEGLQTLIEQHADYWVKNNGESLLNNLGEADWKQVIDAAAAGGLMGGAMGAPAGITERSRAQTQVQRIEQSRQEVAQQGGDALDQAMAGQQAEQSGISDQPAAQPADPEIMATLGNRLQLAIGELDDLQHMARGASYQGQTRLRNITRMLDEANADFEAGRIEQAQRRLGRAELISRNLRDALNRTGSSERPARVEGELVDGEPQGVSGLLGNDSRRLPPGDPNTIYGSGPTVDATQYDPQARTVRRDERMAAQQQGASRMREGVAAQRPQLTDQGIVYGDGPVAGNANTGLDQTFERARFTDTGARQDSDAQRAEQQRRAQEVADLARTRGPIEPAYLADNTPVRARYRVMDLSELTPSNTPDGRLNPRFPQELQPRDRTNANSQVQVRNIAANLNPERLGRSNDASTGAPIIGADGVVESGNGRTMAIAQAYQTNSDRAQAYRRYVAQQAEAMGMDPAAVAEMAQPVLVRERVTNIDRAEFARRANESTVAGMTSYEQAQADADSLSGEDLQQWSPDQSGDPLAASNRAFLRTFVSRLGSNEASRYTTRDGQATPELASRMQRAVFAKAYADSDMVEMATEQGDAMRNLTGALQAAASDLAIARETGSQDALAAIDTINDAVRLVRRSRQDGTPIRELVNQTDAFAEPVPALTADLALTLNTNMRSRAALEQAMRYIGQAVRVRAEGEHNGALFEDTTTNQDVFDEGFRQAEAAGQRASARDVSGRAARRQPDAAEGRQADPAQGAAEAEALGQTANLRGERIDDEWTAFADDSGTLGIPRSEMPQVKAEHRGALANFLKARGVEGTEDTVPAASLKPTQAEFSEAKVATAKERQGSGDRAILVSADDHVLDGHHQWMAKADQGEDVRVIRLDAPITQLLEEIRDFPSVEQSEGSGQSSATGEARYRLDDADKSADAPTAEAVRNALAGMEEQLGDFTIIDHPRELPQNAIMSMALQGVNPRDVKGLYLGDQLYIIAGNNLSLEQAVQTAVHEAVGHKGMRGVLGDELVPVMRSLYRNLPHHPKGRESLNEVLETYTFLDKNSPDDQVTIAEEMVAHLLEKGHRPKAWQRAVAAIRSLLRRLFPSVAWTYTDVLALGEQSRAWLQKRQADPAPGSDEALRFALAGRTRAPLADQFSDFTATDRSAANKIGPKTPTQRALSEAIQAWRNGQAMSYFKERWEVARRVIRQGLVDRYAALLEIDQAAASDKDVVQNSTASSSWVLARMANAANGALHAMLHNGRVYLDPDEKVIDIRDDGSKGLGSVLGRLGSAAEIERFMGWIAGNRSHQLAQQGRENLFEPAEIDAMRNWNRGTTENGQNRAQLYDQVFSEFQQYRDDVLAIAEQSGIISADQRAMWRDEFYVPFYRISEQDKTFQGPIATSGLSRQQAFKKLKGGTENLNDLLQNTMMNFHHLMEESLKNQAAMQAVKNAEAVGIAQVVPESNRDTTNSTFVMRNGQKVFYQIDDPLVFKAITSLAHPGMNSAAMKVMRGFKRVFTNMTTVTPQFVIANLIRDSLQASATSQVSKNALANMITGGRALKDARTHARMMASGASFNFGHLFGNNPDELRAQLTRDMRNASIVSGPSMVPNAVRTLWSKWNDVNNFAENLNRGAIYQQNRDAGRGKLYSAFESRDLMDFSAHGAWPAVRILIDIVPFLNARLQGLDKIYRSGIKPGANTVLEAFGKGQASVSDRQAAARFWMVTGALAMATMALYAHNHDDEEYKKLEDWQKDTYWWFRVGDKAFTIPKPFEVGAIATLTERMLEQAMDDEATGALFRQRLVHMLTDTFSFSPVPQAFQPILNVYSNKDDFTGRPIESMGMDRLSPELRRNSSTTAVGQGISTALNSTAGALGQWLGISKEDNPLALSPVQVDHLIQGYLGQVGAWAAGMTDVGWRTLNGQESPAQRWYEYQPVRRFYQSLSDEDRYTKYGTLFYDGLQAAQRAYSDVKELREMGELERAREVADSRQALLRLRPALNRAQAKLRKVNQQMDMVRRSNLGSEEKRQRMDRLRAVKNQIQQALGERVQEARAAS